MASELYLMEVGGGRFSILLCSDRTKTQMPAMTPAEALISFSELDDTDYRKAVRWLRDGHPLFEEQIDIPVSGFVVTDILHRTLQTEDDGIAMLLLAAGQQGLQVMEEPLRV